MWRSVFFLLFISLGAFGQMSTPAELKLDLGGGVSMDLVLVQPGRFSQGSPVTEEGREEDESGRQVAISQAFYVGKHPVTRGQFAAFAESTRYRTEAEKGQSGGFGVENGKLVQRPGFNWRNPGFPQTDEHPVVIVTAQDARSFCQWLSTRSGRACALPTEAQWEYACRAGSTGPRYLGLAVNDVAWHRGNSGGQTQPVGQKKPNAWGLHDFYGPVWQWCSDWYAPYPGGAATDPNQTNPSLSDKPRQVLRGGSFLSDVSHSRSAERYRNDPASRNADNGFRIVAATAVTAGTSSGLSAAGSSQVSTETSPSLRRAGSDDYQAGETSPWSLGVLVVFGGAALIFLTIAGTIVYQIFKAVFGRFGSGGGTGIPPVSGMTPSQAADFFTAKPAPLGRGFTCRVTDSGFYILGPDDAAGAEVQYTAQVDGRVIMDNVLFSPGPEGQFIFTGSRPKSVSLRTTGGMAGTSGGSSFSSFDDDPHRGFRESSSSSSSRSYPSAY